MCECKKNDKYQVCEDTPLLSFAPVKCLMSGKFHTLMEISVTQPQKIDFYFFLCIQ